MSLNIRNQLLLIAVCVLLFFTRLGVAPLWDRDEPRNAGCTAEMMDRGDLVVPVFNDELRTHKPILLYWLMMVSYSVFGVSEFGARAVSAVAGIGTVLLTYHLARRLFDSRTAIFSGVVLASTIMFCVASRAATPDALLILWSTLAIYCFVRGSFRRDGLPNDQLMPSGKSLYAMYAAMGLGVLTKGPVGLILPTAVVGMYLLVTRLPARQPTTSWWQAAVGNLRAFAPMHFLRTCWDMRPVTALLVAGALALPWYAWVHVRTAGVWTAEFFWIHNVSRASATMEGHSGPPVLFYVVAILFGFFPWSILAIPTGLNVHREVRKCVHRHAYVLLLCWLGVYVGLFSLAQTKLPSYVTPCYPALAIMVGHFVSRWVDRERLPAGWLKVGLLHWGLVGIAMLVGLPLLAGRLLPGSEWLGIMGCIPLGGACVCWWFITGDRRHAVRWVFTATSVAFVALLMAFVPAEVGRHRQDSALLARISQHDGPIVAYGHLEPSWVYYGGRPIREFEAARHSELASFLSEHDDALLLTTDRRLEPLAIKIPLLASFEVFHQAEYFLRSRNLLLLKSAKNTQAIANRQDAGEPDGQGRY